MTEKAIYTAVTAEIEEPSIDEIAGGNGYIRKIAKYLGELDCLAFDIVGDHFTGSFLIQFAIEQTRHIIDDLTMARSVEGFLAMKYALYKAIKSGAIRGNWMGRFIEEILFPLGIIGYEERNSLMQKKHTVESWHTFVQDTGKERTYLNTEVKIVDVEAAQVIIKGTMQERYHPAWIGYVGGKWRQGVTEGHVDLFRNARRVLGNGLLIAAVESERSIRARLQVGDDYAILPDDERLRLLASQQDVDLVILIDPPDDRLGDLSYFDEVEAALQPHYRFIGYRSHEYFDRIAAVCRRLGTILLWDCEGQKRRTTERIADLQNRR